MMCVSVCVWERVRVRARGRDRENNKKLQAWCESADLDFLGLCVAFFLTLNPFPSSWPVHVAFDMWSRRVRFRSSDPILDSSLVIMSTDVADEGGYLCRISTFPLGNFDREMSIIVWSESHPCILTEPEWITLLVESQSTFNTEYKCGGQLRYNGPRGVNTQILD